MQAKKWLLGGVMSWKRKQVSKERPLAPMGFVWVQRRCALKAPLVPWLIRSEYLDESKHECLDEKPEFTKRQRLATKEEEEEEEPPVKAVEASSSSFPAVYAPPKELVSKSGVFWKEALRDPPSELIFCEDEVVRFVYDKYPKAQRHLLGLAPPGSPLRAIDSVVDLRPTNLEALRIFHEKCKACADHLNRIDSKVRTFRIGYHAEPSMNGLHCHIISDDFDAPALKVKKHYVSFATDFFVPSDLIESLLEATPKNDADNATKFREALYQRSLIAKSKLEGLKCFHCKERFKTFPSLKKHLPCTAVGVEKNKTATSPPPT